MATRQDVINTVDDYVASMMVPLQQQIDGLTAQLAKLQQPKPALKPYPATGGPAGDIVNGTLTIKDAGVTVEGYDIPAWVRSTGANTTVRNSIVRGTNTINPVPALIYTTGAGSLFEDVVCVPTLPQNVIDGMFGHGFTARRVEAYHVTDGFGIAGDDVLLEDVYVHDLVLWAPDTANNRPVTHNDACQIHTGRNIVLRRGVFHSFLAPYLGDGLRTSAAKNAQGGYNTAWDVKNYALQAMGCIMVNQLAGTEIDVTLDGVFLDGGGVYVNVAPNIVKPGQVKTRGLLFGGHNLYRPNTILDPNKVVQALG